MPLRTFYAARGLFLSRERWRQRAAVMGKPEQHRLSGSAVRVAGAATAAQAQPFGRSAFGKLRVGRLGTIGHRAPADVVPLT